MEPLEDDDLLAKWQAGDAKAGESLVERYFARMHGFFRTKLEQEADELVQLTFLGCLAAKDRFRADSSFRTFLYGIAKNQLYAALRTKQRMGQRLEFDVSSMIEIVSTPRTKLAREQDYEQLVEVMRQLPVNQQALLELHYWDDVSIPELAKIFEAPEVTIRSRLHRARGQLKELLEKTASLSNFASSLEQMDGWARSLAGKHA